MSLRSPRGQSPLRSPEQDRARSRSLHRSKPRSESPSRSLTRSPSPGRRDRYRSKTRSRSPSRGRTRSRSRSRSRGGRRYNSRSESRSLTPNPSPPRSSKIVVEKLTKNVTESHIREIFGGFGEIEYLDLPINKAFMTNRGTAYILYYDPADAEAAIAHMHEAQLDGAILNVSIVLPRHTVEDHMQARHLLPDDTEAVDLQNAMTFIGPRLHQDHDLLFALAHTLDLAHHRAEVAPAQTRGITDAGAQATAAMVTAVEVAVQTVEATIETKHREFFAVLCLVVYLFSPSDGLRVVFGAGN
ncbi:hypothetical protein ACN42_g8094 [Penicillium freii]|uniref:RRM domain-containing protein n=1 Tax=Penicillium freii TaxID=48697 RepID=A0A101MEK2_PENFR|nr:hypothetical protein ACN42_g8094 [Penicillium freii]